MKKSFLFGLLLFVFVLILAVTAEQTQASVYYNWSTYSPTIEYDYQEEYGTIDPPTQICPDGVTGVAGTYIDGWWCFRWGANKNSLVTSDAWIPMLQRYNADFAYITDIMRWPREQRAREGYYSTVYLYGSGLSTDSEPNTALGGWQSWAGGYPMVLASYYPVYSFDPSCSYSDKVSQQGAMIHEGIHCILSSMPGCKSSCWFQEGGNTWLQGTMEGQRTGNFSSMGWLSAGAAIAPFMPIECYSGWLQDDSFGGPCAEGVGGHGDGVCTWRNLLGGTQYGECFPHALEGILGPKSIAWLWRNCHYSGRVLQDLAEAPGGLGETQTRRVIQEYRARQAFCDFGQWSYAFRQLLTNNWGANIHAEYAPIWINCAVWYATCYVSTTQNGSVLTPEVRTLPGWSGANQIPLTINPSATEATVTFDPNEANMSCQLVYRDTSGNIHYGVPVSSGDCNIPLANVKNNVIIAVICDTDYIYNGESTRTAKYYYTLTIGAGVTGKASTTTKWYDYSPASYTITASAGANGTINPSGAVSVTAGASKTFTFTPNDANYTVYEAILNGLPIGAMNSYTFNNVRGNLSISVTFRQTQPPTPNPESFSVVPTTLNNSEIIMEATTGTPVDPNAVPIQYLFEETSGHSGGTSSNWQSSPIYTDIGLAAETQYTYTVKMRDSYGNTTAASAPVSATTLITIKNVLTDNFDTTHDFLTQGVSGTIWDGLIGQGTYETVTKLNSNTDAAGQLYLKSTNGRWPNSPPTTKLGPLLYKNITGDFTAIVKETQRQVANYNIGGLMARVADDTAAGPGEDWVATSYYPPTSIGNKMDNTDNGVRTQVPPYTVTAYPYLMLERVGDNFYGRVSSNGTTWIGLNNGNPVARSDMSGLPVQVGIYQGT